MIITDSRKIITRMAEKLVQGKQDLVSIDMQDIEKVLQYQNVQSLYIDGPMENVISTLNTFSTEFADAKLAVMQISTPTADSLKMKDVKALLEVLRNKEEQQIDVIWGTSVKSDIPQGGAEIFIVYAAD